MKHASIACCVALLFATFLMAAFADTETASSNKPLFPIAAEQKISDPRETFETIAQFAELHHDIVKQFGRFPHRNKLLGRENTPEEDEYLAGDSPDFGQGD